MADAREPEEGGSDLFDRWLSHRQESTGDDPRPRTYGVPRTGLPGAGPEDGPADATRPDVDEDRAVSPGAGSGPDVTEPPATGAPVSEAAVDAAPGPAAAVGEASGPAAAAGEEPAGQPPETGLPGTEHAGTAHPEAGSPVTRLPEEGIDSAEAPAAEHTAHTPDAASAPERPARRAPVGLDEFEPVVIASVRRSAETPVEKRSRLARFRRAGLEPDPSDEIAADDQPDERQRAHEQTAEHGAADDEPAHDQPADDVPAHEATGGQPAPAPEPEAAGEVHPGRDAPGRQEDAAAAVLAAFHPGTAPGPDARTSPTTDDATEAPPSPHPAAAHPPATAPAPEPERHTPDHQHNAAAAVFAAFNPGTAPSPDPSTSATADDATDATKAAPTSPHPAAPHPPATASAPATRRSTERRRARRSLAAYVEAARTTLDRSVRGTPEERLPSGPAAAPEAPTGQPAAREAAAPTAPAAGAAPTRSAYDELRAQREAAAPSTPEVLPPSIDFRPRTLARRVTSVLLLVGLAATGAAAWRAYESRVETDIGLAAILALTTGVVWAVRAGSVPTRVGLHGGVLEVRSQAGRFVFEVSGAHTRLEVVGTPGRRGSRLLVHRRGLAPFALTPAMVDLRELVEALRYYRPDL